MLDYGFTESHAFLVTEYLEGAPFAELAGAAPLRVLTLLLLLVDGLEALASRGIATRNPRAENLLVVPEAPGVPGVNGEQVKILGLGSADLEPGAVPVLDGYSDDLHAFALLACRLLKIPTAAPLGIPLAVAIELRDVEALRALLDAGLKGDPDGLYPSFVEVRQALRSALFGESRPRRTGGFETRSGADPVGAVDAQAASDAENALLGAPPLPWAPALSATAATAAVKVKPAAPAPIVQILPDLNDLDGTMMVSNHFIAAAPSPPAPSPPPPLAPAPAVDVPPAAEATGAAHAPMPPMPPGDPFALTLDPPNPADEVGVDTIARPPDTRTFVGPRPSFWRSRILWLGLPAAALVGTGVAAVLFFVLHPAAGPPPAAPPVPPLVVAVSRPLPPAAPPLPAAAPAAAPAHPQIVLAETALAANDLKAVKTALDAISPADQAALRPDERERYQRLLDALTPLQREELASALARGLERGDLRALRSAVRAVPPAEQGSLPPAVQKDLARARQAVEIDGRLARAQKEGNPPEVIRQADALLAALPRAGGAARAGEAKERAAGALELTAGGEIEAGQYDAAAARLESLRQVWPDRPGLAGRIERLAAERKADQDAEAVLAAVARAEKAGKPQDALQLLAGARASRRAAPRFQEARQRLEGEVAQLDRHPPELALRTPEAAYEKGKTATIALRITDDFAVKTVEGWARPEGGQYVKVAVRHLSGADYAMDVPPDVHQNKTVEFYVTAADPSGHAGQLGSADHPLRMKRKSWIEKILGKNDKGSG